MSGNKQIIVLGRGRSGTSLVAGLLDKMGVDMGKSRPPSVNNPKGYFEDVEIMNILDKYVKPIEEGFIKNKEFEKEFKEYVKKKKGLWGWKQPNTLYILPSIVKYLDNPHFIVCYRDWKKQTESIKWAFHNGLIDEKEVVRTIIMYYDLVGEFFEKYDYPVLNVEFENFFNKNKTKQIKKICEFVGVKYNPNLEDFIDPSQPKFL